MSELNPVEPTEDLLPEDFRSFLNQRYGTSPAVAASVDGEVLRRAKQELVAGTEGSVSKSGGVKSGGDVGLRNGSFWRYAAVLSSVVQSVYCFRCRCGMFRMPGKIRVRLQTCRVNPIQGSLLQQHRLPERQWRPRAVISGDEDRSEK